jgi:hypothetical protein
MKSILQSVLVLTIISLPAFTFAGTGLAGTDPTGGKVGIFLGAVLGFIDAVLIPLILGIAFLMFVWGVFKFFVLGGSDSEKQTEGKSLMIYAIAGFVLILSFYGIINVLTDGLGFGGQTGSDAGLNEVETGFDIGDGNNRPQPRPGSERF